MAKTNLPLIYPVTKNGQTKYRVDATIGHKPDGTRIRKTKTVATMAEAKTIRRTFTARQEEGRLNATNTTKVGDYGLWWIREVQIHKVKQSTAADYELRLRKSIIPLIGQRQLTDLTTREVEAMMANLKHQGLSTATINGARRVLFGICKHAVKNEIIKFNPVANSDSYKAKYGDKTQVKAPWSKEEAQQALHLAKNTKLDLFLHIGIFLGLRRGEILGLKWSDIDYDKGTIKIERTLKEERRYTPAGKAIVQVVADSTKTRASNRTLPLETPILLALDRHKEATMFAGLKAGANWQETEWIFKSAVGTVLAPTNFAKLYKQFCRENQLRQIRIHDLRHTTATLGLEAGSPLEVTSQGLGHTGVEITKKIYAPYVARFTADFGKNIASFLQPVETDLANLYESEGIEKQVRLENPEGFTA